MSNEKQYILTLSCDDVRGIVAAVSGFLTEQDGFIIESAQYGDPFTHRFFMRTEFAAGPATPSEDELKKKFYDQVGKRFNMDWNLYDRARKPRLLIMVSKFGHCLNDLMHRHETNTLRAEVAAVVSNHQDLKSVVEWHKVPFYYLPVSAENKTEQETQVMDVISRHKIDVVVLARYMQILSGQMSKALLGRAINIHHSFLPSFKGAKPYHQAYDRGVKLIGATAHYVTDDLDEGPIIDQEVARVDHTMKPEDLAAMGRDIECVVLARALKYHAEHRVLLNGHKTVIFK